LNNRAQKMSAGAQRNVDAILIGDDQAQADLSCAKSWCRDIEKDWWHKRISVLKRSLKNTDKNRHISKSTP
jgi:cob(I)alamin adenosyltransferase